MTKHPMKPAIWLLATAVLSACGSSESTTSTPSVSGSPPVARAGSTAESTGASAAGSCGHAGCACGRSQAEAQTGPAGGAGATASAGSCGHAGCACGASGASGTVASAQPAIVQRALHPEAGSGRTFGQPPVAGVPAARISELLADPARFEGREVELRGTVAQVCQRMGCWMELRGEDGAEVRVPLAGHSFFLPRDVVGKQALVQGRVLVAALTPEQAEHYRSEGARVLDQRVSVEATSVLVR